MTDLIDKRVPYYMNKEIDFDDSINHLNDFDSIPSRLLYSCEDFTEPLVSIVIPCYNADMLETAVESALEQDFSYPYEIVIVDNNSDKKEEIEKYVKQKNSRIIRYFRNEENIGLFGNWNRCIVLARANYIVYLHADDALLPNTLSKLWKLHCKIDKKSAIIGRYITLDSGNKEISHYYKKTKGILKSRDYYKISKYGLLYGDSCNGCGALLNKEAMINLGGWNPDYFPGSDRVLFLLYAERYGLYRLNDIVRKETFAISTSSQLFKKYPSISYYLSRAVIIKYFKLKPLWHFFNYHAYIVYNNTKSLWETDSVEHKHIPRFSRIIDFVYKFPYRLLGGKRFLFS